MPKGFSGVGFTKEFFCSKGGLFAKLITDISDLSLSFISGLVDGASYFELY